MSGVAERLKEIGVGRVRQNVPLSQCCTWHIGGPADVIIEPQSAAQLVRARRFVAQRSLTSIVIGAGSNLLFDDAGFRGIVIRLGRALSNVRVSGTSVISQAGIAVPRLARSVGLAGLTGIEHTVGIPGTLGGLVAMNGGSSRKCIGDVIQEVTVVDRTGHTTRLQHDQCRFARRSSIFQTMDCAILEVNMALARRDPAAIRSEMLDVLRSRRRKFPRHTPNCGSVFLGTAEDYKTYGPPGKVIEQIGAKGRRVGDAQVSCAHGNFIVNIGRARSADVLQLIREIRDEVQQRIGCRMRCETRYVFSHGALVAADEVLDGLDEPRNNAHTR